MLKVLDEKTQKEKTYYLKLMEIDAGEIVLSSCDEHGNVYKNLLVVTPEGVKLSSCAYKAGVATDSLGRVKILD